MTTQDAIDIATLALITAAKVALPFLLVILAIGLIVGLFQSVTQLQEPTLSFVPKLISAGVVIAIAGPWMLEELISLGTGLMARAPQLLGG